MSRRFREITFRRNVRYQRRDTLLRLSFACEEGEVGLMTVAAVYAKALR